MKIFNKSCLCINCIIELVVIVQFIEGRSSPVRPGHVDGDDYYAKRLSKKLRIAYQKRIWEAKKNRAKGDEKQLTTGLQPQLEAERVQLQRIHQQQQGDFMAETTMLSVFDVKMSKVNQLFGATEQRIKQAKQVQVFASKMLTVIQAKWRD